MKYKVTFPNEFIIDADTEDDAINLAWERLVENKEEIKVVEDHMTVKEVIKELQKYPMDVPIAFIYREFNLCGGKDRDKDMDFLGIEESWDHPTIQIVFIEGE